MPSKRRNRRRRSSATQRHLLLAVQQGRCFYCLRRIAPDQSTRDHVVPRSRGGTHDFANKVAACRPCNRRKGDRVIAPEWVDARHHLFLHAIDPLVYDIDVEGRNDPPGTTT